MAHAWMDAACPRHESVVRIDRRRQLGGSVAGLGFRSGLSERSWRRDS